jgi:hypothetical protein
MQQPPFAGMETTKGKKTFYNFDPETDSSVDRFKLEFVLAG